MKNKRKSIMIVSLIILVGMIVYLIIATIEKNSEQKSKVGLILSGVTDEDGWNKMHYEGLKSVCEKSGVELFVKEDVKEFTGECEQAIKELAEERVDLIILSSYGYSEEVVDCVTDYPDIAFYANSSENHASNMTSYFVRMYQARYLSGVLAGMRTESNQIGYVAAMPNNEVNRGISAFTLGVRSVNPDANVVVIWSGTWDDAEKEAECTRNLIEKYQVDLVTYHQNGAAVLDAAENYRIDSIGYHQEYEGYSQNYLTSVVCNWDKVYAQIIKELLSGETNTKENFWIGLNEEAVGLSALSKDVTEAEKEQLEQARKRLLSGQEVFSGLIFDIDGQVKCNEGEIISDAELLEKFDWYAMGVKLYEE